jgi:hypothetical protein
MGLLSVESDVVAKIFYHLPREVLILHLCFLDADNVRLVLLDQFLQLVWAGANAVAVERDNFHGLLAW